MTVDETNKQERYVVFTHSNVDVWFWVYFNEDKAMPKTGDTCYVTTVFRKKGERK